MTLFFLTHVRALNLYGSFQSVLSRQHSQAYTPVKNLLCRLRVLIFYYIHYPAISEKVCEMYRYFLTMYKKFLYQKVPFLCISGILTSVFQRCETSCSDKLALRNRWESSHISLLKHYHFLFEKFFASNFAVPYFS